MSAWFTTQMDGRYYPRVYTAEGRYLHINSAETMIENQANARLIAAAPELLAALREVLSVARAYADVSGQPVYAIAIAERAIAKAVRS